MKKIRSPKDARHISPDDRPCFFSRGKFDFSSRDFHEERYDEGEGHSSQMFALLRMWNIDWPVSRVWGRLLFNRKAAAGHWVGGHVWGNKARLKAAALATRGERKSYSLSSFEPWGGFRGWFPFWLGRKQGQLRRERDRDRSTGRGQAMVSLLIR